MKSANFTYNFIPYLLCFILLTFIGCKTDDPASLPTVTTELTVTKISATTAISGGAVTDDKGQTVTSRGVCWSTSANPTIKDSLTKDGSGAGTFASNLNHLVPNTSYYVRSYATSKAGTAYGNSINFTTLNGNVDLNIYDASSIKTNSVTLSASTISDGGSPITERGFCLNTSSIPTISNIKVINGKGLGAFSTNITGLVLGTKYYARAYAINEVGVKYGNEINFMTQNGVISLTSDDVYSIYATSATFRGTIVNDGGSNITERGFCYSLTPSPTTANSKISNGTGTGAYFSNVSALKIGTKYYVKSYAINSIGTFYSSEKSFTTNNGVITLNTNAISSLTAISATCGGNVLSDGGGVTVTSRGVCWSTSANPTIADSKSTSGNGTGSFSVSMTQLSPATTYYIRAFATNSVGTVYGNQISGTTQNGIISLTTNSVTAIRVNSATCGGNVLSDGGGVTVTSRGVCWSTSANPTIADSKSTSGNGLGSFTCSISGLSKATTYYIRSFATNSVGTVYGNQYTITTAPAIGDNYLGGKLAHILSWSETGYVSTEIHGYIAAPYDQGSNIDWYSAVSSCSNLVLGGYDDWALPSKTVLEYFYQNRVALGITSTDGYWSSSVNTNNEALVVYFYASPASGDIKKSSSYRARATRSF